MGQFRFICGEEAEPLKGELERLADERCQRCYEQALRWAAARLARGAP